MQISEFVIGGLSPRASRYYSVDVARLGLYIYMCVVMCVHVIQAASYVNWKSGKWDFHRSGVIEICEMLPARYYNTDMAYYFVCRYGFLFFWLASASKFVMHVQYHGRVCSGIAYLSLLYSIKYEFCDWCLWVSRIGMPFNFLVRFSLYWKNIFSNLWCRE